MTQDAPTPPVPPAQEVTAPPVLSRPQPRPRAGAAARVGVTGTRPPTRRPGAMPTRGDRPDPSRLPWKPTVPFTVGQFTLDVEADLGAYGLSFAGREPSGPVQVLVLHPAFFSAERRAANLERLERARRCEHPAIAPILGAGELGPTRWVATRPVDGTPLTHWRREHGAMPLVESLRVIAQLADALEAVHAAGAVHGGLSPESLRFYPGTDSLTGGRADLARLVHPFWLDAADVPPGELRSPRTAWLAPELAFGEVPGAAADVYGLGLVLGYLLACGLTEPGHSLLVQGIDVPPGLDDVYVVATSRQPEHRFESVAAMREALEAAAGQDWLDALERSRRVVAAAPVAAKVEVLEVEDVVELTPAESTDQDVPAPLFQAEAGVERTDTALPAFILEGEDEAPAPARAEVVEDNEDITATGGSEIYAPIALPPGLTPAVAGVAPTGRGKRIVVPTLPHGQRPGSGEVPTPFAPAGPPSIGPGGPPPLPPGLLESSYSASLEVLDQPSRLPPEGPPRLDAGAPRPTAVLEVLEVLDEEVAGESTLVEEVAPALLAASAEILGPPPVRAEPLAHVEVAPPPLLDAPDDPAELAGASLASLLPPPPPPLDEPLHGGGPTSGLLAARDSGRGPRVEALPSGTLKPLSVESEPRTLRDPSGILAGAPVAGSALASRTPSPTLSTGPLGGGTLGELNRSPLSTHIARPVERRRSWVGWAVLAALLVGGVLAFLALGSGGDKGATVADKGGDQAVAGQGGDKGPVGGSPTGQKPLGVGGADVLEAAADVVDGDAPQVAGGADIAEADTAQVAGGAGFAEAADTTVAEADTAVADTVAAGGDSAVADTTVAEADTSVADTTIAAVDPAVADATVAEADTAGADISTAGVDPAVGDAAIAANPSTPQGQPDGGSAEPAIKMPEIITDPDKLKCPDGMLRMRRKIKVDAPDGQKLDSWDVTCIDRFEYPGGGASPSVGLDLAGARAACAGRGKRLCTRSEWRRACGGTYPYGREYDAERCNTAAADGTPRPILAAGAKKGCMSPSGAFDMVGNVAEWTSDGFINGGTSLRNSDDATCGSGSRRAGGAPHVGFRCCADAK